MTPLQIDAATDALAGILPLAHPADATLSRFFRERAKLGARDRAFVAEAVFGVLRHLRSLSAVCGGREPRRLLLAWLARHGGHNLREFADLLRAGEADWLKRVKATRLDDQPEAVRLELPDWLYDRLHAHYGEHLSALMQAINRPALLDLRVNPMKTDRAAVLERLGQEGFRAVATPYSPLGIRLLDKPALQNHPLFLGGELEVQDEGSQLIGLLVAPRRGEMICDFCAGAGGKTLLLGALMRSTGRLYAFDVAQKRLDNLKRRLKRSGLSNVQPKLIAGERDDRIKRLAGKFDRVLVDAPCSGTGTLRRNPDLKWRQTEKALAELTDKQQSLLAVAATLVKPGGRLIYATCSLLDAENELIVANFLAARPGFRLVPAGEALAAQRIALAMGEYLRLDPRRHGTDGFFAAVLERVP